ncbi:hypothetical protein FRC18_001095 [Serendipita sp. 400]|nr:hypothetical protein FRC18_001095 [Serendipita sp. 400]
MRSRDRLEVEDEDQRLDRLNRLLSTLNSQSQSTSPLTRPSSSLHSLLSETPSNVPSTIPNGDATSELLARVQAFLPQLAAANQALDRVARENPSSVDIECFGGDESSYIEMVRIMMHISYSDETLIRIRF